MKEDSIDEFMILPSIVGKDVIDLEKYAKLPRIETYDNIESFLESARKSIEVNAIFIKAEWGEGKTSIFEGFLQKPEVIGSDVVIKVDTSRLITVVTEDSDKFTDTKSPGNRFFAALLYAIKDALESKVDKEPPLDKIKIPTKKNEKTVDFIAMGLNAIFRALKSESRVFVFLDEFEDVVDKSEDIQSFIIGGLVSLINGEPEHLFKEPYAGRFNLMIAVTPTAYEIVRSKYHADIGRLFGQRIRDVELEKLTRETAYNFILGCLKFSWGGNLPRIPFCKPGMFNAIYTATLGNPRAIVHIIRKLLTKAKMVSQKPGKIRIINSEDFISYLLDEKIPVYGGEVNILSKDYIDLLYDRINEESQKRKIDSIKACKLVELFIANPVPLSEKFIEEELDIKSEYSTYLSVIASAFKDLWKIHNPFIFFKKVKSGKDEIYLKIKLAKSSSKLPKIVKAMEFYEFDRNGTSFIAKLFVPYDKLDSIKFNNEIMFKNYIDYFVSLVPEISDEDEITISIDREIFPFVEISEERYIMLAPTAINIFYPSPSIFFLDFIEDVSKRFEVGMEVMRNLPSFEEEFYRGIFRLVEDGGKNVRLETRFERHGVKDVEVTNVKYSIIGAEEYGFRAFIIPKLQWTMPNLSDEFNQMIDKMEDAQIPLLLIFSWNPIPNNARGIIASLMLPGGILYYLDFPLSTLHAHQIVARIIAEEKGYNILEERWCARASRILEEIRFEEILKDWIEKGLSEGYTVRTPVFRELKLKEVPRALRIFLITDGKIKDRYNEIKKQEELFKIHGKEFGINPLDVESESALERIAKDLQNNGFIELGEDGEVRTNLTKFESRIVEILKKNKRSMHKEELERFFVIGVRSQIDLYLETLIERRYIKFHRQSGYEICGLEKLENEFEERRKRLNYFMKHYDGFYLGYLTSIKQRNVNAIIAKECLKILHDLAEDIYSSRFVVNEERKRRKYYLFELLMNYFDREINELLQKFDRNLTGPTGVHRTINALVQLEEIIPNYLGIEKKIVFQEKNHIENKKEEIKNIKNQQFNRKEIKELGQKIIKEVPLPVLKDKGLVEIYKNCPVFDIKEINLHVLYEDLRVFLKKCEKDIRSINESLGNLRQIRDKIEEHDLFKLEYEPENAQISLTLLEWVKQGIQLPHPETSVTFEQKEEVKVTLEQILSEIEKKVRDYGRINERLDNLKNLLENLYETEKKFNNLNTKIGTILDKLNLFYEEFDDEKGKLVPLFESKNSIAAECSKEIDNVTQEISKLELTESNLSELCDKEQKFLGNKIKDVEELRKCVFEIFEKNIKRLYGIRDKINRLTTMLQMKSETLKNKSRIEETLKQIREITEKQKPPDLEELPRYERKKLRGLYKEILDNLLSSLRKTREIIVHSGLVSEDELNVLENLYEYPGRELEANEIIKKLSQATYISDGRLKEILFNLDEKGLVTLRVFIE